MPPRPPSPRPEWLYIGSDRHYPNTHTSLQPKQCLCHVFSQSGNDASFDNLIATGDLFPLQLILTIILLGQTYFLFSQLLPVSDELLLVEPGE